MRAVTIEPGTDGTRLVEGVDSYVVRHDRIVAQTIHHRVEEPAP
jgi:hypothetical protein